MLMYCVSSCNLLAVRSEERRRRAYPDIEVEVLVLYRLDVEAYRRYCCDYLTDLRKLLALLHALKYVTYLQSI
jgi:hypothetical protein